MPSEIREAPHERTAICQECRFWVASTFYDLHQAGKHGLDVQKIMDEVHSHRLHGVLSKAHFHGAREKCNEECVA